MLKTFHEDWVSHVFAKRFGLAGLDT